MGSEQPRRDGDAMPAVDEAVAAILTVRDYLDAGPVKATKDQAMRAFIGIVATWKRDRAERDALAKRCEAVETERDTLQRQWQEAGELFVKRLPHTADGVAIVPGMILWRAAYDGIHRLTVESVGAQLIDYADETEPGIPFAVDPSADNGRVYSTRAAAESAAQEGTGRHE